MSFSNRRKPTREELLVSKAIYAILLIVSLWFPIFKIQGINLSFINIFRLAVSIGAGDHIIIMLVAIGHIVISAVAMFLCEIFRYKQKKYVLSLAIGNCVALLGLLYVFIKVLVQEIAGIGWGTDFMIAFAVANIIYLFYEYRQINQDEINKNLNNVKDENDKLADSQKK